MRPSCNRAADLLEVQVHGVGVGPWQHQRRARIAFRADGTEQVGRFVALIGGQPGPRAPSGPDAGATVLLADPRFVLKPDLNWRVARHMAQVGGESGGEVFLKASITLGACLGCCGRALIWEYPRVASSLEMVLS